MTVHKVELSPQDCCRMLKAASPFAVRLHYRSSDRKIRMADAATAAIASAATAAGSAARRAGGEWAAADVTGILRSMGPCSNRHQRPIPPRFNCRDTPQSHPRGLTRAGRPLYSARFAAPALRPATEGPCGGTGRRARLKIEFRKECWFDSGQGHQLGCSSPFKSTRSVITGAPVI